MAVFFCLQVALVALWSLPWTPKTETSIATAVLGLADALAIASLSYTEHRRSIKPSAFLNAYLCLTVILDIASVRTCWIRPGLQPIAGVSTAALAVRTALLVLEETPKPLLLGEKDAARETVAGVISRSLFWWLNALFYAGARLLLRVDDLGSIERKFESRKLLAQLEEAWDESRHSSILLHRAWLTDVGPKTGEFALLKSTFWAFRWQFAAGAFPRLLFSGFTFAQPFLISSVVDFVGEPENEQSNDVSGGLIGATALIYLGLAVSNAWYKHMTFQLLTMFRGSLA